VIILEVGDERVVRHGHGRYTFGNKQTATGIDPALGRAIEVLVTERDEAVKRADKLEVDETN